MTAQRAFCSPFIDHLAVQVRISPLRRMAAFEFIASAFFDISESVQFVPVKSPGRYGYEVGVGAVDASGVVRVNCYFGDTCGRDRWRFKVEVHGQALERERYHPSFNCFEIGLLHEWAFRRFQSGRLVVRRLDVAVDVARSLLCDPRGVRASIKRGHRWWLSRTTPGHVSLDCAGDDRPDGAFTFYVGSRATSFWFLRVYDKGRQLKVADLDSVVRCELEIKPIRASGKCAGRLIPWDWVNHPGAAFQEYGGVMAALAPAGFSGSTPVPPSESRVDRYLLALCRSYHQILRLAASTPLRWESFRSLLLTRLVSVGGVRTPFSGLLDAALFRELCLAEDRQCKLPPPDRARLGL